MMMAFPSIVLTALLGRASQTELRTLKDNVHLARQLQQLGALRDVIENQVQRYEDCLRECADCAETLAGAWRRRGWVKRGSGVAGR